MNYKVDYRKFIEIMTVILCHPVNYRRKNLLYALSPKFQIGFGSVLEWRRSWHTLGQG